MSADFSDGGWWFLEGDQETPWSAHYEHEPMPAYLEIDRLNREAGWLRSFAREAFDPQAQEELRSMADRVEREAARLVAVARRATGQSWWLAMAAALDAEDDAVPYALEQLPGPVPQPRPRGLEALGLGRFCEFSVLARREMRNTAL